MILPIWPLMETTAINLTEFLTLLLIVYLAFELEFMILKKSLLYLPTCRYQFENFPIHYPPLPKFLLFELTTTPMQTCNTMCQFDTLSLGMKWNVIFDQNNI
jgi:hypothetical protein